MDQSSTCAQNDNNNDTLAQTSSTFPQHVVQDGDALPPTHTMSMDKFSSMSSTTTSVSKQTLYQRREESRTSATTSGHPSQSDSPQTCIQNGNVPGPLFISPTFKATSALPGVWSPKLQRSQSADVPLKVGTSETHSQQQAVHRQTSHESVIKSSVTPMWKQPVAPTETGGPQFRPGRLITYNINQSKGLQDTSPKTAPTLPPPPNKENMIWSPSSVRSQPPAVPEKSPELKRATAPGLMNSNTLSTLAESSLTSSMFSSSNYSASPSTCSQQSSVVMSPTSQLSPSFSRLNGSTKLPRSQSPTITLLQKAREGQISKGAIYIDHKMNSKDESNRLMSSSMPIGVSDSLFRVKSTVINPESRKITLEPIRHEGIGPTTEQGMPVTLRTGIKEENKGEWYKKMYKSLHRLGDSSEDDCVVVKYRRRGRIPYSSSGYMSEPEPERDEYAYYTNYATLDRRRPRYDEYNHRPSRAIPTTKAKSVFSSWTPPSAKYSSDVYRNQPRRIEDYEPGHSSIAEREAKLDDEVDKQGNRQNPPTQRTTPAYMFKDGYESDSTLVYHKHDASEQLDSNAQRMWYKEIQRGGDIPITGLRRPAPDRPKEPSSLYNPAPPPRSRSKSDHAAYEQPTTFDLSNLPPVPALPPKVPLVDVSPAESPHRYVESEVNIHYRAPIRTLEKDYIEEEELRRKQEDLMKQFYEDEKRKKYLQELSDIENRRHSDHFIQRQKSPIPLDRYDHPFDTSRISPQLRARTPEPKTVARALYNFTAQNARELTFNKNDIIIITRRIDKNWYEGEHHGMIGLFPFNYVEIIPYDNVRSTPKKLSEGLAKAKYNFHAQTSIELPLVKGELVVLTRRVDQNWYMGRIGGREGIFPVMYVEVVREPGETGSHSPASPIPPKPVASPVSRALIMNGSATLPHQSYPAYNNQPNYYNQKTSNYQSPYATMKRYGPARPPDPVYPEEKQPVDQSLHIDTHSEPVPYRALYDYQPQNEDELQLRESDTVYVMEKCDDGWYVGSSLRTGLFGTFPGNYVERL